MSYYVPSFDGVVVFGIRGDKFSFVVKSNFYVLLRFRIQIDYRFFFGRRIHGRRFFFSWAKNSDIQKIRNISGFCKSCKSSNHSYSNNPRNDKFHRRAGFLSFFCCFFVIHHALDYFDRSLFRMLSKVPSLSIYGEPFPVSSRFKSGLILFAYQYSPSESWRVNFFMVCDVRRISG